MPYPKLKSETYHCQGGINTKVSLYITAEGEFLNLQNVDFRTVGALSSFAGSTILTTVGATSDITGIAGFILFPFKNAAAGSTNFLFATDAYNTSSVGGNTFSPPSLPNVIQGNTYQFSFALGGSALFGCNNFGDFWTFQGSTVFWQAGLPKPLVTGNQQNSGTGSGGLSGTLVLYYSLVRSDGLFGPSLGQTYTVGGGTAQSFRMPASVNMNIGSSGLSYGSFGLSGIQVWAQLNNGLPLGLTPLIGLTTGALNVTLPFNWTAAGWAITSPQPYDYQGSFLYGLGLTQGSANVIFVGGTDNPTICEVYANQLFTTGFSENPNRVLYSNPGTPEVVDYANFFDVGGDSVPISGMRAYFTQLMIWKQHQTFVLSGTGPDTFVLTNISTIYGCIAKNANVVWNQNCWFLDEKGIFEFNGANVQCVSNKVDDIFRRMNKTVAATSAYMIHDKIRNEVWCAIPIDNSPVNNIIVVYDYLSSAWTTRTTPPGNFTVMAAADGRNGKLIRYGSSGMVGAFGSSYVGDNGTAFTSIIKTRFIEGNLGNSVTKMFRRLYVDATIPPGLTYPVTVNFYQDKGASIVYSTTMMLSAYQNRIDYGIPAKSIAVEFIYSGASFFQLSGFTIEYRYQRNT